VHIQYKQIYIDAYTKDVSIEAEMSTLKLKNSNCSLPWTVRHKSAAHFFPVYR